MTIIKNNNFIGKPKGVTYICPICKGPVLESRLYEGLKECIACKNDNGEGYQHEGYYIDDCKIIY